MTAWIYLNSSMLSEMSVGERQIPCDFTYRCNLKNKTNKTETRTDTERELVVARGREAWGPV